jgi:hypothetical protein
VERTSNGTEERAAGRGLVIGAAIGFGFVALFGGLLGLWTGAGASGSLGLGIFVGGFGGIGFGGMLGATLGFIQHQAQPAPVRAHVDRPETYRDAA